MKQAPTVSSPPTSAACRGPQDLLDLMKAKLAGGAYDRAAYDSARHAARSPNACASRCDTGIDIVSDGEQSKPGFFTYVRERLEGFEARPRAEAARSSPQRSRPSRSTTRSISSRR